MVITFAAVLIGLLALIRPLQRNGFYILHCAVVILSAYYVETHYFRASAFAYNFRASAFAYKTFLLFIVFHFISINLVTILAYWKDKRAAMRGDWRTPEAELHTLELLGGWSGALLAQKLFHHKTKKRSYQSIFWLMLILQLGIIWFILRFLHLI